MLRLQGQKQCLYSAYKREVSAQVGVQRHKYSLIVDLKNSGFGILFGKKKSIIQQIFKVGSDYFPESIWKIYVINAPFIFRARAFPPLDSVFAAPFPFPPPSPALPALFTLARSTPPPSGGGKGKEGGSGGLGKASPAGFFFLSFFAL
jgi:hypothetical protein